jgi:NAD(P)-dependent dehydrogenase (short-subunit alcohol dehydrogenase family)
MAKWTADDIPDQGGRTIVVTGANSGLGLHTARALVSRGAQVLMACRSPERGEAAVKETNELGGGSAELVELDLANLASVRRAAAELRERTGDAIDVLVNNAGVMATPKTATADGFELQLGTNHFGHAALTWLLMPALRTRPGARVVSVTSKLHSLGKFDATDPNFRHRRYRAWPAYGQSKTANLLFAFELDRRARAAGLDLVSVAAHPGLSDTELTGNMMRSRGALWLAPIGNGFVKLMGQPGERGAWPTLYAATAPDVAGGQYWGPDGFQQLRGHPTQVRAEAHARDAATAARLWDLTAELVGVDPDPA